MRLIDADAVLDMMNSQMDMQELYLPIHFKELVIDQLPTAYDVDKVLENLGHDAMGAYLDMKFFQDGEFFRNGYFGGKKTGLLLAIEEVKGGFLDAQENNKGLDAEEADAY